MTPPLSVYACDTAPIPSSLNILNVRVVVLVAVCIVSWRQRGAVFVDIGWATPLILRTQSPVLDLGGPTPTPLPDTDQPATPALQHSKLWGVNGENFDPQGRLLDWSHAGYHASRKPLPVYEPVVRLAPNPPGTDAGQMVRDAIAGLGPQGGTIHLTAGTYEVTSQVRETHHGLLGMALRPLVVGCRKQFLQCVLFAKTSPITAIAIQCHVAYYRAEHIRSGSTAGGNCHMEKSDGVGAKPNLNTHAAAHPWTTRHTGFCLHCGHFATRACMQPKAVF